MIDYKLIVKAVLIFISFLSFAFAGDFEDAVALEQKGNYSKAASLYLKAAKEGDSSAQANIATLYRTGRGVPQSIEQAIFWWRKAAELGNRRAEFNLGISYSQGNGVKQDEKEAIFWIRKAAEHGHPLAQFNLGNRYEKGLGVEKDNVKAIKWLTLASRSGDSNAKHQAEVLAARMNKGDLEEAKQQTVEWMKAYLK